MARERKRHVDEGDAAQAAARTPQHAISAKSSPATKQLFHFFLQALARDLAHRDHEANTS